MVLLDQYGNWILSNKLRRVLVVYQDLREMLKPRNDFNISVASLPV